MEIKPAAYEHAERLVWGVKMRRTKAWNEIVIRVGIERARRDHRHVDERIVRDIALALHTAPNSPLYRLAATGELSEHLKAELDEQIRAHPRLGMWGDSLLEYAALRADKGPVPYWGVLWLGYDYDNIRDEWHALLFSTIPDKEFGTAEGFGWCGLLRYVDHQHCQGGSFVVRHSDGRQYALDFDDEERLLQAWYYSEAQYREYKEAGGKD